MDACLFVFFFLKGDRINPVVLKYRKRAHSNKSFSALFKWPNKLEVKWGPLPRSFFPEPADQNFEIAILFSIVEKYNNYVFKDESNPHSSRGKGRYLWTLPIVYI